ncbi:hypothetical protein Ccrd_009810 [Cynara cardunculus var. scolymus]|uniref:non-specific serine/threonine protein kinase n=1 Tax=Cynara cardunculus var. scolymus TaxID=59895 RepID=A0A103YMD6_CYNCS|nr:Concanavalin A-like lectin/glucanase, subgroup [Cynara cardunculus var. scolymus]KVI11764.1 hypothetical protein Ccrd_009810 [Cynara cardunculus var. scolymus]
MNLFLTAAVFLMLSSSSLVLSQTPTNSTSCPLNFDHVLRIPWPTADCRHSDDSAKPVGNSTSCCQTLLSVFGIALAQHLKETSLFHLPDLATSSSCLSDFQNKLNSLSLPSNLATFCFDPHQFVISSNTCAAIQTVQDWRRTLGNHTVLDSACQDDLTELTACDDCLRAGLRVHSELALKDGNASHSNECFYFVVLYAAAIVNKFGPESDGAVSCTFGINILPKSHKTKHSSLIFGLIGGLVAIVVISCLVGLYFWWDRKRKREKIDELGMDEFESGRPRRRPNTGSIWFKIHDLEKATDNFSPKNFIGRGGFGVVYKGVLSDGSVVAVKKIIESEFEGTDDFCNEVEIISNLRHRNLVPLKGCCIHGADEDYERRDDQRYLVYEYMSNGNLDDHLFPAMKGKVLQALDPSLVGHGTSSETMNPRGIMERFVLVGILCAHVMVALRPTIMDALKMLEGDIEVPAIPDRPTPLGHPSFTSDGSTFSISPVLSGLQLQATDMLR